MTDTASSFDQPWNPSAREPEIYAEWESRGYFQPRPLTDENGEGRETFSVCIPPPNVTGSLHMGHALNNTLQDVLARFERMRGKSVLWQPGMDHAGIATQMVVERQLMEEQKPRSSMSREEFVAKVWEWKEKSGGRILEQLKRLGSSADWSRTKFTLGDPDDPDDLMAEAVTKAFVQLYEEGLIYRDKRLVNWDPHFQTAISDLEVENIEVDGHMWHFKYPLEGGQTYTYVEKDEDGNIVLEEERDYISIATTRPETMLGDGAVAVHPDDERYAPIVGKLCEIPVGPKEHRRLIPIITDEYPDPDFGSGAVKITGAHDENDHGVAERNGIPMYSLMDEKAAMRSDGRPYAVEAADALAISRGEMEWDMARIQAMNLVPDAYRGMDRYEARKAVVADIDAEGLMIRVEDKKIMQPFGDRSKVVIEPRLTDQWFVDAETLAKPAMDAVARNIPTAHPREGGNPDSKENLTDGLGPRLRGGERNNEGNTQFIPANWTKTYDHWMKNIQPWCISRQLWWGHRVPAWYGPKRNDDTDSVGVTKQFVARTEDEAVAQMKDYYSGASGDDVTVTIIRDITSAEGFEQFKAAQFPVYQDPDVLDTWFSSALWPFSTLGWPEDTDTLEQFYPTSTLITAFDIIFFWVARMMMMGLHFQKEVPFRDVYIHALVLDEDGKKMSKSEGNTLDPLDLIDGVDIETLVEKRTSGLRRPETAPKVAKATRKQYPDGFEAFGADALRFTLASMAGQGRNIRLSVDRIQGNRNFGTKLWNAARFAQMNGVKPVGDFDPASVEQPINRWLVAKASEAIRGVTDNLERYRFNDAADAAYKFAWGTFCDWYLELSKATLSGPDGEAKAETQATAAWALDVILKLLHPFMPFVTEELWHKLGEREDWLIVAEWPTPVECEVGDEIDNLIGLIGELRSVRSEMNVPPSRKAPLLVLDTKTLASLEAYTGQLEQMGRVSELRSADALPDGAISIVANGQTFAIPAADLVDLDAERARLAKAIAKADDEIGRIDKKLGNPNFVEKAPEAVVAEQKSKREEYATERTKLQSALDALG